MIELQIHGLSEIERRLSEMQKKVSRQIVRTAIRDGAKAMYDPIKANIRSMVGGDMGKRMANALAVRAWKRQKRGLYGVGVRFLSEKEDLRRKRQTGAGSFLTFTMGSASSIKSKKQIAGRRYYIPWAIEYGHAFPGRGGQKGAPKDVAAISYYRTAFDSHKAKCEKIIGDTLLKGVEEAMRGG